jgi:ATP-dependent helicase/nuclease subunit B
MTGVTALYIRLCHGRVTPTATENWFARIVGGPEDLLEWLETQLGLPQANTHRASRVMQYANATETVSDACFAESLQTDRWETASDLLARRDELLLCGWDGSCDERLPRMVQDLAKVEAFYQGVFPGEAERLRAVAEALEIGQSLPPHECFLSDELEHWPAAWQAVLRRMTLKPHRAVRPQAPEECSLHAAGLVVRGETSGDFGCDASLRIVKARSETASVEFVASVLAHQFARDPARLARTIVYCEDDELAIRLDASLYRRGVPTMGATSQTNAHPVLQVLPLALELCWEPVNPQCLLDLLTLPVMPLPRRIASRLARALSEQPGLGSAAWDRAFEKICEESDQDIEQPGKMAGRLREWFCGERAAHGEPIATALVAAQCRKVAKWALGRAALMHDDEEASPSDEQVAIALGEASRQAALLGELVELSGEAITQPQLGRLLDEVSVRGVEARPFVIADGGPTRVRSLAEIAESYDQLMWLGTTTGNAPVSCWSVKQIEDFATAGVELDDGTHALRSLRRAEADGLCLAKESMLVVMLPSREERRTHPMWLAIEQKVSEHDKSVSHAIPSVEDLVTADDGDSLSPFTFRSESVEIESGHSARPEWAIPAELMKDREQVSASELEDRLACPLKWTLRYQAGLRSSEIASLPDEHQLRGNLFHALLERVFNDRDAIPDTDLAVRLVEDAFNERLPLDAAPLAQPEKRIEAEKLRNELIRATQLFVETLHRGGYTRVQIEEPINGTAFGKPLTGSIDCIASTDDGREAVVDFKYGGRTKYHHLISEGRSVQLATYAQSRKQATGTSPSVAYLLLSDGKFIAPSGSPLEGLASADMTEGPSIESVWNRFSEAISSAEAWLTTDEPVPARPLQDSETWPTGVELVLKERLVKNESQSVCRYCDFSQLCGLEAVR